MNVTYEEWIAFFAASCVAFVVIAMALEFTWKYSKDKPAFISHKGERSASKIYSFAAIAWIPFILAGIYHIFHKPSSRGHYPSAILKY